MSAPKLLRLILSLCAIASLTAQESSTHNDEKREAKGRVARFICSNLPNGIENPVTVSMGEELTEVVISKYSVSVPVKISADGMVKIVRKIPNTEDPKKPKFLTLAQTTIPESVSDALIILVPTKNNPQGLLFQSKVQDLASHKAGETMFLNLTNFKIGVELGTNKIALDPGNVKAINPLAGAKVASLPISVHYYDPAKKEWVRITASTVGLYANRREFCIFLWDSEFERIDYESVTVPFLEK